MKIKEDKVEERESGLVQQRSVDITIRDDVKK